MKTKPLITLSSVRKLLLRNCDYISPEIKLALGVIEQVFQDLSSSGSYKQDAIKFFIDGRNELWCEFAGINASFVKEIAIKGCFINEWQLEK